MMKVLELIIYEQSPRELQLFFLDQRRLEEILPVFILDRGCKEDGDRFLSGVPGDKRKGVQTEMLKFHLNVKK